MWGWTVVRSEARRAWWLLLLLASFGCSFDRAPLPPGSGSGMEAPRPQDGRGNTPPQAGASAAGSASVEPDGGAPAGNMSPPVEQPVVRDAATSDASNPPPPVNDAAIPPPEDARVDAAADTGMEPEDAAFEDLFEPCDSVDGCSEGLVCYGEGYGYCSQPCQEDSDCTDFESIDFTCSPNEFACRVDCTEAGSNGVCPQGLTCIDLGDDARCLPPDALGFRGGFMGGP
jgi:hypothetical protein